jgi:hypothetical protein
VTTTFPRALFAAASGIFAISFIQDTSFIFRDEYELNWLFYVGMGTTLIQIALLALPVFLVGKRVVAAISVMSVYFVQFLFGVLAIIRDLEYLFDFGVRGFFQYWILPMLFIPNYIPGTYFESLFLETGSYLRFIGIIFAILGAILTFVAVRLENQKSTTVGQNPSAAQMFVPSRSSSVHSSHGNATEAIDQVERLGDLLKKGLITQEEFETKKRQILGL